MTLSFKALWRESWGKTNLRQDVCVDLQSAVHLPSSLYYSKQGFALAPSTPSL